MNSKVRAALPVAAVVACFLVSFAVGWLVAPALSPAPASSCGSAAACALDGPRQSGGSTALSIPVDGGDAFVSMSVEPASGGDGWVVMTQCVQTGSDGTRSVRKVGFLVGDAL